MSIENQHLYIGKMSQLSRKFAKLRGSTIGAVLTFFRAGRSLYVLLSGILLLALGAVVMAAASQSREVLSASGGWDKFVALAGTNQWISGSFLLSSACVILSINYLPRLEGEV